METPSIKFREDVEEYEVNLNPKCIFETTTNLLLLKVLTETKNNN